MKARKKEIKTMKITQAKNYKKPLYALGLAATIMAASVSGCTDPGKGPEFAPPRRLKFSLMGKWQKVSQRHLKPDLKAEYPSMTITEGSMR